MSTTLPEFGDTSVEIPFTTKENSFSILSVASEGAASLYRVSERIFISIFRIIFYCIRWLLFGSPFVDNRSPVGLPEKCGQGPVARIVGGETCPPAPWQVSLRMLNRHICGGALITVRHVISAAHCLNNWESVPGVLKIGLGSNSIKHQKLIKVSKISVHESFTKNKDSPLDGDIAVITLREDVDFNLHIQPICLPQSPPNVGTTGITMGWGKTEEKGTNDPNDLLVVSFPVLEDITCQRPYMKLFTDNMICAGAIEGGKDSCQGDSGGPLLMLEDSVYTQFGVVSFGQGCGRKGFPGVYTKVVNYLQWINDQMG